MMKKILKPLLGVAAAAIAIAVPSCESFEKTNTNPNVIDDQSVQPMYLATPAIVRSTLNADMWQRVMNLGVDTYAQYFCNDKYDTNLCVPNDEYSATFWNNNWTWIANLQQAIKVAELQNANNVAQLCRIWRAWIYMRFTDYFGDIPYSQACNIEYSNPVYDHQKDIYYDLIKEVSEASAALTMEGEQKVAEYDLIFGADWSKWRKLANTLHLRLAMRLTEVDPAKAKAEAEAAAAAPGGFLEDNVELFRGESAYTSSVGYNMFYVYPHYWPSRLTMSTSMEKILTNLGGVPVEWKDYYQKGFVPDYADPRALINFNVTSTGTGATELRERVIDPETGKKVWKVIADFRGRWQGVKPGLTAAVAQEPANMNLNHSRLGAFFVSDDPTPPVEKAPVMQKNRNMVLVYASEAYFLLAEAALRGYNVGGSAQTFYEEGIRKSMSYYGSLIKSADVETYLTSDMKNLLGTSVAFNSSEGGDLSGNRNSKLMKIITQKYIANFPENSYEAWNDYRRLGMPVLDPFEMAVEGFVKEVKGIDYKGSLRRFIYPAIEQTLNAQSYQDAVSRLADGDATTSRMWWDCRTTIVE